MYDPHLSVKVERVNGLIRRAEGRKTGGGLCRFSHAQKRLAIGTW